MTFRVRYAERIFTVQADYRCEFRVGEPVRLEAEMIGNFELTLPLYNQALYYYYFEELADPVGGRASVRSVLDRFRLRSSR